MKTNYVKFIGKGQPDNAPSYVEGTECIWSQEIEAVEVVTMSVAKQIIKNGEMEANERFGYEHKFYQVTVEINDRKQVHYNMNTNTLTVWENHMPIYRNCNGVVSRDTVSLSDGLL